MSMANGIISSNILATKTTPLSTISPGQSQSGYVKYMECLKNHAVAIGGKATDGCGEFMPGGEQGSLEALMCAACDCHRNFHKKICLPAEYFLANSNSPSPLVVYNPQPDPDMGMMMMMMMKREEHDDDDEVQVMVKKRYRSKFSQEQKDKMLAFAEKCEWKIHNVDDSEVRQLCQEIGIKRKVLRIWMHNNKHNHMPNKNHNSTTS